MGQDRMIPAYILHKHLPKEEWILHLKKKTATNVTVMDHMLYINIVNSVFLHKLES